MFELRSLLGMLMSEAEVLLEKKDGTFRMSAFGGLSSGEPTGVVLPEEGKLLIWAEGEANLECGMESGPEVGVSLA